MVNDKPTSKPHQAQTRKKRSSNLIKFGKKAPGGLTTDQKVGGSSPSKRTFRSIPPDFSGCSNSSQVVNLLIEGCLLTKPTY